MSQGIVARLRGELTERVDLGGALPSGWGALGPADLARQPIRVNGRLAPLGDVFDLSGSAGGLIRFEGDLARADRIASGLTEGAVEIAGDAGDETGLGMSGGAVVVRGSVGHRAGGAAPEARRGMTGGELIVAGDAGDEAGTRMRRGLLAVGGRCGSNAGAGMLAGTLVLFRGAGPGAGLWSKRGSIIALGPLPLPPTYRLACTYQPVHVRLILGRLRARFGAPVEARQLSGRYRRYSGDLADLGKGEILEWTA